MTTPIKYYAGIGSRKTPEKVLKQLTLLAQYLEKRNYILRSGGAIGADKAFEAGSTHNEIFRQNNATLEAQEIAGKFHPFWSNCNDYTKKLMARNIMILLGKNLNTPVEFVLCWTDAPKSAWGGTNFGILVAKAYKIPVFNLYNIEEKKEFSLFENKSKAIAD